MSKLASWPTGVKDVLTLLIQAKTPGNTVVQTTFDGQRDQLLVVHALPERWGVIAVHEPTEPRHARSSSWFVSWPPIVGLHWVNLEPNPYGSRASVPPTGITPGWGMRCAAARRWTGDVAHEPNRRLRAACVAWWGHVGAIAHRYFPIPADRRGCAPVPAPSNAMNPRHRRWRSRLACVCT
jgi:hypothetical protein